MKKLAIMLGILFIPNISSAAPSISNVSGNFNHGNYITISGGGFGTKSPAKPKVWIDFEEGSLAANSSLSANPGNYFGGNLTLVSDTNPHTRSNHSAQGWARRNGLKDSSQVGATLDDASRVFFFGRQKTVAGFFSSVSNNKYIWLMPNVAPEFIDTRLQITNFSNPHDPAKGGMSFQWTGGTPQGAGTGTGSVVPQADLVFCNKGNWCISEFQDSKGDLDGANGTLRYWLNGILKFQKVNLINRKTKYPAGYKFIEYNTYYQQTIAGTDPPDNGKYYFDDLYIDTTWSRVMIGNAATYNSCTHREPLIPTAWSSSSITAYFNQGSFPNGQSVYVFVVDSDGNASTGKAITIGGAATFIDSPLPPVSSSPNPPANLIIN